MPRQRAWRATPRILFPLLSGSLCPAAASEAHAVAQAYTFRIREEGKVVVRMDIEFQIAAGATLSGSYKSILDSTSLKSIEDNRIIARDSLGRQLDVRLVNTDDWLQARFTFPDPVRGDGDNKYAMSLEYTVLNGICSGVEDFRFYFPWAHRWIVPVTRSTYRIQFPDFDETTRSMNEVCLAGTAFNRRCGRVGLNIQGASAEHTAIGFPHGLFFQWPRKLLPSMSNAVTHACPDCGAEDGCGAEEVAAARKRASTQGRMLPQGQDMKTSTVSTVVVVLAIILCCLLAVVSAFLRRKLHQWGPDKREGSLEADVPLSPRADTTSDSIELRLASICAQLRDHEVKPEGTGTLCDRHNFLGNAPALTPTPSTDTGDPTDNSWCPSPPPQWIGSSATAGIDLEIDDGRWPSSPSISAARIADWQEQQRQWQESFPFDPTQGYGHYYSLESPSASSSGSAHRASEEATTFGHGSRSHRLFRDGCATPEHCDSPHGGASCHEEFVGTPHRDMREEASQSNSRRKVSWLMPCVEEEVVPLGACEVEV